MSETFVWIDADGVVYDLNDGVNRVVQADGIVGVSTPGFSLTEAESGLYAGARVTGVKTKARDVELPMVLSYATRSLLFADMDVLAYALDPNRGDGRLRMTRPDGVIRDLYCRCINGMGSADKGFSYREMTLIFRGGDPYWYDTTAITEVVTEATGTKTTWFPFFPLQLCSASMFATITLTNGGKVETWPVWTICGPGSEIVLSNKTTIKTLTLEVALAAGDTLVIDTRPGCKSIKWNGNYRYDLLDGELWPLIKGENIIGLNMLDAGTGSQIDISHYNRYL